MATKETSRQCWVRETRESVHRALAREYAASAAALEGNLDITRYSTGLGFTGVRSAREINAALRWLESKGWARRTGDTDDMYGGAMFELTVDGDRNVPHEAKS